MGWYSRFVTNRPWVVIGIDLLLVLITGPIAVWYAGPPDFSDPNKGFEPRGTSIHGWNEATIRLTAQLLKENGSLSYFPSPPETSWSALTEVPSTPAQEDNSGVRRRRGAQECLAEKIEGVAQRIIPSAIIKASVEEPPTAIPRMVAETLDNDSLWKATHMHSICQIEKEYIRTTWDDGCPAFSLPYYIGALRGKKCEDISDRDMEAVLHLLRNCSVYYVDHSLTDSCHDSNMSSACDNVPEQCKLYNAPYYIFHYLTDVGFLKNGDPTKTFLKYSTIIYRKSWDYDEDSMLEHFLKDLEQYRINVQSGKVVVRAMDYYLIFSPLSRFYILSDLPFYVLAMILVVLVLLFYLRSPSLMLAVMLNVGLSLFTAYFLYHVVFQFKYFTFVNLLACLLLIAVGADDVFILHDIWEKLKLESDTELSIDELNSHTLNHGVLSILVTSLTTAAALFANSVNDVTALKCFGIFGGVCILVNFYFMITLVPAILVLSERYSRNHPGKCSTECTTRFVAKLSDISQAVWRKIMPVLLLKPWLVWLVIFAVVGVGGLLVVFYQPALRLPTSERIQVFYSAHPFEVYRDKMLDQFHFEIENEIRSQVNIELQFPFGIKGEENGNILDPDDRGHLEFDKDFAIYSKNSQDWMKKFCTKLLQDTYTVESSKYRCFFDIVQDIVQSNVCSYPDLNISLPTQCCNNEFPLPKSNAKICYNDYTFIRLVTIMANASNNRLVGMPVYRRSSGKLVAMTHQIETDFVWTAKYPKINEYYTHFEDFMLDVLKSAPNSVNGGWFAGAYGDEFFFYDLQKTMVQGTISGIALSMSVGFLVMLFTSGNVLITVYSIVTIALVIAVTVASLVLLGWELEVLEALVITLAVGLSIDFTIHLAVAYKVSPHSDRLSRTKDAVATVGSAVTMAGLTTFLSGAAITLGRVMSYYKFGVFLMLVMTISWAFSLFFFIPLCRFIGPVGRFGELKAIADKCFARCGIQCLSNASDSDYREEKTTVTQDDDQSLETSKNMNGCIPSSVKKAVTKRSLEDWSAQVNVKEYMVDHTQDFSANKTFILDDIGKEKVMYFPGVPQGSVDAGATVPTAAFQRYSLYRDEDSFNWTKEKQGYERFSVSAPISPVLYVMTSPYVYTATKPRKMRAKTSVCKKQSRELETNTSPLRSLQRSHTLPVYSPGAFVSTPAKGWNIGNGYKI